MSTITEDDTELRDLVAKVLDGQGILGKIKAQLRAHVYTVLEQGEKSSSSSALVNRNLRDFLATTSGRLVASLVREFLEFFSLDFTLAVFDPETNIGKDFSYRGRERLIEALGLTELVDAKIPLLSEVMRLSKVSVLKSESPTPTEISAAEEDNSLQQPSLPHDRYSDFKSCERVEESNNSSNSNSLTPEIPVELGSLSLRRERVLDVTYPPELPANRPASASLLSDLPPLGPLPARGELPPLNSSRPLGLAPLKKVPPLQRPEERAEDQSQRGEAKQGPEDNITSRLSWSRAGTDRTAEEKKKNEIPPAKSIEGGEEEEEEKLRGGEKYSEDFSVCEEIEEDLDSFLNSSQSGADDFTREENLPGSDVSLRADYAESL